LLGYAKVQHWLHKVEEQQKVPSLSLFIIHRTTSWIII